MTAPTITGGSITYDRSVKVADYENKKLGLTLSFNAPEGQALAQEAIDALLDNAISTVHVKLGLQKPPAAPRAQADGQAVLTAVSPAPAGGATKPTTRGPKKPPVIEVQLSAEEKASLAGQKGAISETPEDRKDPSSVEDVVDAGAAAVVESQPDPAVIDDDLTSAAAPDITDAELTSAVTKKNAQIKNPVAIRQCIGTFVKPPKGLIDIPKELRADFLAKLDKL